MIHVDLFVLFRLTVFVLIISCVMHRHNVLFFFKKHTVIVKVLFMFTELIMSAYIYVH